MITWNGFDCLQFTRTQTSGRQQTDQQRHTVAEPFKFYPVELGYMLFRVRQIMQYLPYCQNLSEGKPHWPGAIFQF